MAELVLSDANFESEVLKSDVPAIVDFWAPWCGPCRVQGPIVEKLAAEFAGQAIKIGKMNVDENPTTGGQYNIMSIPTILIYKGGQVVDQLIGVTSEDILRQKIQSLL